MAVVTKTEVHETRHVVELSPEDVRDALLWYASKLSEGVVPPQPCAFHPELVDARLTGFVPRAPAPMPRHDFPGVSVRIEWVKTHDTTPAPLADDPGPPIAAGGGGALSRGPTLSAGGGSGSANGYNGYGVARPSYPGPRAKGGE